MQDMSQQDTRKPGMGEESGFSYEPRYEQSRRLVPRKKLDDVITERSLKKGFSLFEKCCDLFEKTLFDNDFMNSEDVYILDVSSISKKYLSIPIEPTYGGLFHAINRIWMSYSGNKKNLSPMAFIQMYS